MNKLVKRLKEEFSCHPDLIIKTIKLSLFKEINIIYLETVSGSDKVNDYILKNIIIGHDKINKGNLSSYLASPNTKKIEEFDECEFYLTNGYSLVVMDSLVYAVETKADLSRSISDSKVESSINGPKDAFTENIQTNIGLIKRRIKSNTLKIESFIIGRKTKTNVSLLYFSDITDKKLINKAKEKLENIDIDGIIDASNIGYLLGEETTSVYPTFQETERPDIVATELLQGKLAILVDTTPNAIIIPAFFIDFINPVIDNYNKSKNVNFIKVLRFLSFLISMMAPAIYIALMNYNQETIPTSILLKFAVERNGVPFPTIIETLLMLFVCEILRESDLRFPSNYGSAISILGAIVLGEASVSAGIASPITIIVIAITFISSLTFTTIELNNALRYFRFIFIILSGIYGLYGVILGILYFLIYTVSTTSFNYPYFTPIAPFDKVYFNHTVLKKPMKTDKLRSKVLTKNRVKQTEDI